MFPVSRCKQEVSLEGVLQGHSRNDRSVGGGHVLAFQRGVVQESGRTYRIRAWPSADEPALFEVILKSVCKQLPVCSTASVTDKLVRAHGYACVCVR